MDACAPLLGIFFAGSLVKDEPADCQDANHQAVRVLYNAFEKLHLALNGSIQKGKRRRKEKDVHKVC